MKTAPAVISCLVVGVASAVSACTPEVDVFGNGNTGAGGAGGATSVTATSDAVTTTGNTTTTTVTSTVASGMGGSGCGMDSNADQDADGFTPGTGDCDDCDPEVNPNAIEVLGQGGLHTSDEDCDGTIDVLPMPCDQGLGVDSDDPLAAAKAVELCKISTAANQWGVAEAHWVMADGAAPPNTADTLTKFHLGHGLLSGFGPNVKPQGGQRVLALSSGTARQPFDPGYQAPSGFSKGYTGNPPAGFPKEAPSCPGTMTGPCTDPTAIELKVRVPSNVHGFSFDFDFYAWDFPNYVCSTYNDTFVAILSPPPNGQADGNVSFDGAGIPFSVNGAMFDVCGCMAPPCPAGGKSFACSQGTAQLVGTGFDENPGHGATGWQVTTAPLTPGSEVTIRWGVYDSGDGISDSTTLVDNWKWITDDVASAGTQPLP